MQPLPGPGVHAGLEMIPLGSTEEFDVIQPFKVY